MKNTMVPHPQLLSETEVSISLLCQLCSTHYKRSSTNQYLFEKHLCNQVPTTKNMNDFHYTPINVMAN